MTPPGLTFPDWLKEPAVRHAAAELWTELPTKDDPVKAQELLSRLVSDPRMKGVWRELYKRKRIAHKRTDEFVYPACLKTASLVARNRRRASEIRQRGGAESEEEAAFFEAEANLLERDADSPAETRWSEQDLGVQRFLHLTYRTALDLEPILLSDLEEKATKLHQLANRLLGDADMLKSFGKKSEARRLQNIAADCEDEAWETLPDWDPVTKRSNGSFHKENDPWVIKRRKGNAELKDLVVGLSITTQTLFGNTLYSTIASIANVVFNRNDLNGGTVREMLRS